MPSRDALCYSANFYSRRETPYVIVPFYAVQQTRSEKLKLPAIGKVLDLSEGSEAAMWQPSAAGSIRSYQPGPASRAKSEFLKFSRVASGKQNHHHDKLRGAASYTEKTRQRKTHNSKNTKRHRNKVP